MKNIVYFDLETQKSAQEVGGWHRISDMKMSVGVIYSTRHGEYRIYGEPQVADLVRDLQQADLIVGYNHVRFDYEVLHGYLPFDLRQLPSLDLMTELENAISRRLKLDDVAEATLGVQKTADGRQALEWFKQGRLMDIAEYCCYDVKVTKMVHEYGAAHKKVFYPGQGRKICIPVNWSLE